MKTHKKYDPEDIESLMQHKSYDELYPEERAFVLNHLESPEEYASMRQTLLELQSIDWDKDGIEPRKEIKERLMEEFAVERKGGFMVWLNTLFAQGKSVSWYRSGGFQVAMGVLVLALVGTWFLTTQNTSEDMIAEVKQETKSAPIMTDSLDKTLQENASIQAPVKDLQNEQFAESTAEGDVLEKTVSSHEYRADKRSHAETSSEGQSESFALVADNEADELVVDDLEDIAMADADEEELKTVAVTSEIAPKMAKDQNVVEQREAEKETSLEVAMPEDAFADEIHIDNSMGNSVSPTITLESARVLSSDDFNISEISVNEVSAVKAAEGQSIKRYKGLLDGLYTSY